VAIAASTFRPRAPWRWALAGAVPGLLCALLLFAPASWLAGMLQRASGGRVLLSEPRGTVWNGSAQLLLTGGAGSTDAMSLPTRLDWRLRPRWDGLVAELGTACCIVQPLTLRVRPRWGGAQVALANGQTQWPAALLAGLGTPWNTLQLDGDLLLGTQELSVEWVQGRLAIAGRAELTAQRLSSRLSTLRPMGTYHHADPAAGDAGRKPTTERQRPVGGLAPAFLGRRQRRPRPRRPAVEPAEYHRAARRRPLHHHDRLI
jgi:general secretion pathway protein N